MESLLEDWEALRTCNPPVNACINAWVLLALVSSPHFLYAFIWYRPALWMRAFGGKAVDVFALCGALGKGERTAMLISPPCTPIGRSRCAAPTAARMRPHGIPSP